MARRPRRGRSERDEELELEVRMYPRPGGFRPLSDEEPLNKANNEPNGDNEEVHVGLDIPKEMRVSLTAYMLVDKVDFWWESIKRVYDTKAMAWEEFERIFLGKYFREVDEHAKMMEFEHLIQGTMSVLEYESHFSKLSRFALRMISEEREKARRFQQGLKPVIRNRLVPLEVSRVLRGRILLEYVMVMGWEITYVGLAHCGAHNRLNLSLKEVPSGAFQPPQFHLPYYQMSQLPPTVKGVWTATMSSQT
ncbi:hypothetical protein CK203_039116 [Vitis vinifera]|uniref:Retrotransposon gag domain-containing protein n=1 Tax=Vitis vinifera TaxID=29760 RepID=A0A438IFR2_VITVI|nr:hypothetical protein CK203_039116 [Vitis vinifera]